MHYTVETVWRRNKGQEDRSLERETEIDRDRRADEKGKQDIHVEMHVHKCTQTFRQTSESQIVHYLWLKVVGVWQAVRVIWYMLTETLQMGYNGGQERLGCVTFKDERSATSGKCKKKKKSFCACSHCKTNTIYIYKCTLSFIVTQSVFPRFDA